MPCFNLRNRPAVDYLKRSRGGLAASLAVTLTTLTAALPAQAAPADVAPSSLAAASPFPSETRLAAQTGQPVNVDSETSETTQVFAEPDGTFSLQSTAVPTRVRQNGNWVAIDSTLQTNADGTLSPAAAATPMVFSNGGNGPAVSIGTEDTGISLSWPTALPTPVVAGNKATYTSVLPGVDLVLQADSDSYHEVLVVHDATAATNPALDRLHFTMQARGLAVTNTATGLAAVDDDGSEVFHGDIPTMWDSRHDPRIGETPSVSDPGSGVTTSVPLSVPTIDGTDAPAANTVTLTPPIAALEGADVQYPVFIDPELAPAAGQIAVVLSNGDPSYGGPDLRVGACPQSTDSSCNGVGSARSYIKFNISTLTGKPTTAHIGSAEVDVYQKHTNPSCVAEPTDIFLSGDIGTNTVYPGPSQGSALQEISSSFSDNCSTSQPAYIAFNNQNIVDVFQSQATNQQTRVAFALRAPTESSEAQWKRFGFSVNPPTLNVKFDFPPSTPFNLSLDNSVSCPGKPYYVRDSTPVARATAIDYNPSPGQVGLAFAIWDANGRVRNSPTYVAGTSNQPTGWASNSSNSNSTAPLPDGAYNLVVRANTLTTDTTSQTSASAARAFTIDTTVPTNPTVTSFTHPRNAWGLAASNTATFNVTTPGAAGVAYSLDTGSVSTPTDGYCSYNDSSRHWVASASGAATIALAISTPGPHTLYVRSFDDAHTPSAATVSYPFYVAPTTSDPSTTKSHFEAEDFTPTTTADGTGPDNTLSQPTSQGDTVFIGKTGTPLSQGGRLQMIATEAGHSFNYNFTVPVEADYALGTQLVLASHFPQLTFKLDGTPLILGGDAARTQLQALQAANPTSPPKLLPYFDTFSSAAASAYLELGGAHLQAVDASGATIVHHLTITTVGKNPAAGSYTYNGTYDGTTITGITDNGYTLAVDYVSAIAVNNVTTSCPTQTTNDQCFARAMNNKGIAVDGGTASQAADITPNHGGTNAPALSSQALAAAGMAPGSDFTVDGATFRMPQPSPSGSDNVIASGQTIPFVTPTSGAYLDLLTFSTCGATPYDADGKIQVTLNYQDGYLAHRKLPSIPDWNLGTTSGSEDPANSKITLAATLPYRDVGTFKDTSNTVKIYHVQIRTGGSYPLASVTLPYTGSNFTCSAPSIHVLAITTSG